VPHGRLPSSHSGECGDRLHARPGPAPAIARSTLRRNPGSRPLSREAICRRGHGRSRRLCAVQRRRSRLSAVGRRSRSVQPGVVRYHPRGMDEKPPREVRRPDLTTDVRAQRDGGGVPRSGLRSRPRNIEHRLPARCERRSRRRHSRCGPGPVHRHVQRTTFPGSDACSARAPPETPDVFCARLFDEAPVEVIEGARLHRASLHRPAYDPGPYWIIWRRWSSHGQPICCGLMRT
jgi:hypothetical protein